MIRFRTYDPALAERLTRKNMKTLPYWQARPFGKLGGPEATDEEFRARWQSYIRNAALDVKTGRTTAGFAQENG